MPHPVRSRATTLVALTLTLLVQPPPARAADLQPRTVAAFDRYVRLTEAALAAGPFLYVDGLPDDGRRQALAALRNGEVVMERLTTREAGREIDIPDGMLHHWSGTAFIPGGTAEAVTRVLQDYDHHSAIFAPNIERSKLLSKDGADTFRVFLRFRQKKVITVVVNSEHRAHFTHPAADRVAGRIVSTRIAEVDDPDGPAEREKPIGHDGGYLWRMTTWWRILERDGGVYVQCDSVTLTRGIPTGFGWLVGPFVTSIPRESLTFTMETMRKALQR